MIERSPQAIRKRVNSDTRRNTNKEGQKLKRKNKAGQ